MKLLVNFVFKDKKRKTFELKDDDVNIIELFLSNEQVLFEDKFFRCSGSYEHEDVQFVIYAEDDKLLDLTAWLGANAEIVPDEFIEKDS